MAGATLAQARAARTAAQRAQLRALAEADPAAALAQIRRARRLLSGLRFLLDAEALMAARVQGWTAAAPLFARLAALPRAAESPSAAALLRPATPGPGLDLALPAFARPDTLPPEIAARIVLYTAAFGDARPPAPLFQTGGLRCLLFTDHDLAVPGWETRRTDPASHPARALLHARIHASAMLAETAPGAEASLFLDPSMRVTGNLDTLLARWLWPQDLALWRHGQGRGWREVIEAQLTTDPPDDLSALLSLAEACTARGLPQQGGACDTRVIWRRHGDARIADLMAAWWDRAAGAPETADAAFAALLADAADPPPIRPAILPAALGTAESNIFLAAAPWPADVLPGRARPPAGRVPLAFLYTEEFAATASTYLRAGQLVDLLVENDPDHYDIAWTSDFAGTRDRVVLLVKTALEASAPEELAALRARNIAVIGIWDHLKPDPARMAALDASMTLSHSQTLDFARRFPDTPAFHVRHQVNRLIRPCTPPTDRLRTGYFGELANTVRPDSLAGMIELVRVDTSRQEMDWITRLPEFNAHWIVRHWRPLDGAKPFLKGFVAARCGAIVVASRQDEDALYYLGDDYPFFVTSTDPADLEADMVALASAFGGPEWRFAQAIMRQVAALSTDAVVAAEFRAMIEAVTG
jgi:hypothetical protein